MRTPQHCSQGSTDLAPEMHQLHTTLRRIAVVRHLFTSRGVQLVPRFALLKRPPRCSHVTPWCSDGAGSQPEHEGRRLVRGFVDVNAVAGAAAGQACGRGWCAVPLEAIITSPGSAQCRHQMCEHRFVCRGTRCVSRCRGIRGDVRFGHACTHAPAHTHTVVLGSCSRNTCGS